MKDHANLEGSDLDNLYLAIIYVFTAMFPPGSLARTVLDGPLKINLLVIYKHFLSIYMHNIYTGANYTCSFSCPYPLSLTTLRGPFTIRKSAEDIKCGPPKAHPTKNLKIKIYLIFFLFPLEKLRFILTQTTKFSDFVSVY